MRYGPYEKSSDSPPGHYRLGRLRVTTMLQVMRIVKGSALRMYFVPGEHDSLQFHVYPTEYKATIDIRNYEIIEDNLPRKQHELTRAWAELHQEELSAVTSL